MSAVLRLHKKLSCSRIRDMEMVVTAVYEQVPESEGGGYTAYTEELPGAISEGDTLEEARENLRDAVRILLEANRELLGSPRLSPRG